MANDTEFDCWYRFIRHELRSHFVQENSTRQMLVILFSNSGYVPLELLQISQVSHVFQEMGQTRSQPPEIHHLRGLCGAAAFGCAPGKRKEIAECSASSLLCREPIHRVVNLDRVVNVKALLGSRWSIIKPVTGALLLLSFPFCSFHSSSARWMRSRKSKGSGVSSIFAV